MVSLVVFLSYETSPLFPKEIVGGERTPWGNFLSMSSRRFRVVLY
jgi:hypothetical protein